MAGSLLGNEVRRVEDPALLMGQATFVGDLDLPGALYTGFVRSPFAHALVDRIDSGKALDTEGIVAVFTAADIELPALEPFVPVRDDCVRWPLAHDRVRFVGEPVAAVVGETPHAVADALELVDVDYEPLSAVTDPEQALASDAPVQFPELGSNLALGARDAAGESVLNEADVVVRARLENQRLAVAPMEGNAIAVVPGGADDEFDLTVYVSTQMPHLLRDSLSRMFDLDAERVRVVAPHVGGGFGGKAGMTAEHTVAVAVASRLARTVTWVETRSENFQSMPHGRAQVQYAELGLTSDGSITGLRCRVLADAGAYAGFGAALAAGPTRMMAQGVYRIPRISYDNVGVLTNTTPTGAFRGAGRPEATAMLERMIDLAAAELGEDPVELRRRNFIGPDEFPYTTRMGPVYDCGDYDLPLREVVRIAEYDTLRAEQERRIEAGEHVLLGIGVSSYVEITGGGSGEFASVGINDDGSASISVGTSAHGQGHATSFTMIVADMLGLPMESVEFVQSDTATVPRGEGTGGSRSLQLGGSAVREAGELVLQKAKERAARRLEAAVDDVEFLDGEFGVTGVPATRLGWAKLARAAEPDEETLSAHTDFRPEGATFPFGAHLSVVEVDTETGYVRPLRHIAVDDCGRVVNPMIVRGQQHGGAVQGIAQALWEQVIYDEDGNPASGSFADYFVPSAADVPDLETANTETPTPHNPMGVKGIGESATVGATPATQNAVLDALRPFGIQHVDMPMTPQRVWRAIRNAQQGRPSAPWTEPPAVFDDLPIRRAGKTRDADEAVV